MATDQIDFLEIDESRPEYALDKLIPNSDEAINLFRKHLSRYTARAQFWKPRLDIGKKCMNYMRRDILTPGQRAKYLYVEKKWPIEPQEMKPVINALGHQIMQAVPGADITYEDETPPETAAKPETVSTVLTWMKQQLKIAQKQKKLLRNGLVTGYPVCLWFDMIRGVAAVPGMVPLLPSALPWDSALPAEWFMEDDGADIDEAIIVKRMSKAELMKTFPNRKDAFIKHCEMLKNDQGYMTRLLNMPGNQTADSRNNVFYNMISQAKFDSDGGYYFVAQDVFPIRKKRRAWINQQTLDVFIPPPDWLMWQRDQWLAENPEYDLSDEIELTTLWVTTFSTDGFIWENNEHWYQEDGELPAAWYIADMVDNVPIGAGEDMLPYILSICACETEGLSQVRKGTGRTTFIEEGAVKNPARLNSELAAEEGVIITKKGKSPKESVQVETRKPNDTFFQMSDRTRDQLRNVHRVNESAMGADNQRQSDKARQTQAQQALAPQEPYVENYANFVLNCENLLCKFIPRVMTEPMAITIKDEYGQKKEPVEVNQVGFDYSGEAKRVVNDLVSARYRAVAVIGDDSRTSREAQMKDFMQLLEAVGNQLFKLDPIFLGKTFSLFPNRFAREASTFLMEYGERNQAQQQQVAQAELQQDADKQAQRKEIEMEKIKRPRIAFKISAKDVQEAPEGAKIMYQMMKAYEAENQAKEMSKAMPAEQQPTAEQPPEEELETAAAAGIEA